NDKGSRVVPALERLMADWASHGRLDSLAEGKIVGIVNAIGPGRKAAGIGGIEREDGGGGLAGARHRDGAEFPSAQHEVGRAVPILPERPSPAEGKLVKGAGHEAVP